ncbi:MAG: hypothetical protein ACK4XJ_02540 [Fimbriimonadaceae bacterium]
MLRPALVGWSVLAVACFWGCTDPETEMAKGVEVKPSGHARVVNLTSKPVAANLNGLTLGQALEAKGNSAFVATPLGRDSTIDFVWGDSAPVDVAFRPDSGGTVTVYVIDDGGKPKHVAYVGDPRTTEKGKAAIRFVNLTADGRAVAKAGDLELVRDTTVAVDPGRYTITAEVMGRTVTAPAQAMDDGEAYSVVVFANESGEPDIALLRNNLPMILLGPSGASPSG